MKKNELFHVLLKYVLLEYLSTLKNRKIEIDITNFSLGDKSSNNFFDSLNF